jgi:tetratricopeptide (TPR) repeat protein/predicted aspartyl protease
MTVKFPILAFGLAAVVLLIGCASSASAACQFQKIADVPVTMVGLRPTILAAVNGHEGRFLVDTGAFFSGVTPESAAALGMKRSVAPFGMKVMGVGGQERDLQAFSAQNFTFAGMGFRDRDFIVVGRIGGEGIVGNIGENLMGPFDVEYDLANGVIRYFRATGCGDANLAYWSQGLAVSKLSIIDPSSILTSVITNARVDGRLIRVQFDSGASTSVMSRTAAARAGVQVTSQGVVSGGISYGVYGKGLETFLAPFASFEIGDESIKNTQLRVGDIDLRSSDMLLGADFFLSHRILISNSQKKVYFTYSGGPVFRLGGAPQQQAQAAPAGSAGPAASGPAAPAASGQEPKTGAEFARRGAAFAARREFQPAIADYSRAIEIEPDYGPHYRARAMVRLAARQPVLAMADLDESLKRQPDDPEALMRRGELYLASRDQTRAKADFDMAMKLAPANGGLLIEAAAAYVRAGLHEPAVHDLDAWIAANPKAEDRPRALNLRCFARAAWGQELETALADCDAALKRDKTSDVMANRGLVLFRMGRLDEAIVQYSAAIKAQPRAAPALYGRGLAELKKGQKTEGDADIAAAEAIAPGLAQQYRRYGLAPDAAPGAAKS